MISLLISACGNAGDGRESPGDKREWSILQRVELRTRDQRAEGVQFRTEEGYELMGVPRVGDARTIWIMLEPAHPPFYKQMPDGNFWLESGQIRALVTQGRVTSTVESALASHIPTS